MLDRLFSMTEKKERDRLHGKVRAPCPRPTPRTTAPAPQRPPEPVFQHFDRESRDWKPKELPTALPCPLTVLCEGKPLMGIAVVDARMAFDLPMELVPPKEAVSGGPLILEKGGCFLFSDDYVEQNPESKVAQLVHKFEVKKESKSKRRKQREEKGAIDWGNVEQFSEHADPSTAFTTPSASFAGSAAATNVPASAVRKNKTQQIRDPIKEAEAVDRPLFRRQDASVIYGEAQYEERDFYATLDEECPIEYYI